METTCSRVIHRPILITQACEAAAAVPTKPHLIAIAVAPVVCWRLHELPCAEDFGQIPRVSVASISGDLRLSDARKTGGMLCSQRI